MLKINKLISGYGTVQILNGANMKVEKQSIVALLGGNGTGKSTILKAVSGLIRTWKGTNSKSSSTFNCPKRFSSSYTRKRRISCYDCSRKFKIRWFYFKIKTKT